MAVSLRAVGVIRRANMDIAEKEKSGRKRIANDRT